MLFGGRSLEHDVSVVSGLQILHAVDPELFAPMPVYIDQAHALVDRRRPLAHRNIQGRRPRPVAIDRSHAVSRFRHLAALMPVVPRCRRRLAASRRRRFQSTCSFRFCTARSARMAACRVCWSLAAVRTSAAACWLGDRHEQAADESRGGASRRADRAVGFVRTRRARPRAGLADRACRLTSRRRFGWPVIVKPCNLGSSAGVSTAASADELIAGVLKVFEYDVEALIEPFIKNRLELNVAVAGLDEPVPSVTEMPVTAKTSTLSFSEKYKRQGRKSIGSSEGMAGALRVLDPARSVRGDARQRPDATRSPSSRRSGVRAFRESTSSSTPTPISCSSTRSTRCRGRWRFICGPRRLTIGRSPSS